MHKVARRYVTLIEMMIVMFLIAMIIGVIAYNYQGSLDEGKAFKTKTGMDKVKTILIMKLSEDSDARNEIETRWKDYIRQSPLVQNPDALIKDGWGQEYQVKLIDRDGEEDIEVISQKYNVYKGKHATLFGDERK